MAVLTEYRDQEGDVWIPCTCAEWDGLSESNREFINFGQGYVPAKKQKEK
jgi:hypothetical protein